MTVTVQLYNKDGDVIARWLPNSGRILFPYGFSYVKAREVDVDECEPVDKAKGIYECRHCQQPFNVSTDSYCSGCGAEIFG